MTALGSGLTSLTGPEMMQRGGIKHSNNTGNQEQSPDKPACESFISTVGRTPYIGTLVVTLLLLDKAVGLLVGAAF